MAFDSQHKACIIATLAQVEASGNYGTITAPDTLSLGIGQWTQGRAYDLLKRFPAGTDFGATVNNWLAQGRDSWTISARKYQYLNSADRAALSGALASQTGHQIQDSQMESDLNNDYIPRCRELGLDPETETEACMLLIVVMHRWGNYARILSRLADGAGHPATLDSMFAAVKAEGEYAAVPGRYDTAVPMIRNLETNGVQVTGGDGSQPGAGYKPGDDSGGKSPKDQVKLEKNKLPLYVSRIGSNLILHYADGRTITASPTPTGEHWQIAASQAINTGTTGIGTGQAPPGTGGQPGGGGGGTADERIHRMTQEALSTLGKYVYHQWYQPRLHPDQSGVSDCSGWAWYLMMKYLGVDIDPNGTAAIWDSPTGYVVAQGSGTFNAVSQIKEGDLIVCRWWSGGGHIEYCPQTATDLSVGMRGPDGAMGPNGPSPATSLFTGCEWKLKRYV